MVTDKLSNELAAPLAGQRVARRFIPNWSSCIEKRDDVLNEDGAPMSTRLFQWNSGLASVLNVMEDGKSVRSGIDGKGKAFDCRF